MGTVVNLRTIRRRKARQQNEQRAAESRLLHGRSKADRRLDAARADKTAKDLDEHRIDTGDDR
jgi:hypothetical protein